ncbi:hypothetical protein DNTS_033232 [Danionella cerebrum]|uniref:Uncharacterized protein n=1 Tax=Danionella cerebrum TaxID=2873325 RepID=A0A553MPL0_9TELE|nr:hypothetical protein DNTS_033232 [Danionella translucida]
MRHFQLTALVPVRRSGPSSSLCSVSTQCWRSSPFTDDSLQLVSLALLFPCSPSLLESSADDSDLLFSSPNHFPLRTLHSIVAFSRRPLESSGLACDSVHRVAQFPRGGRCRWDMCNTGHELGPGSGGILECTLEGGEPREIVRTYPPTPGAPLAPVVQHQAQHPLKVLSVPSTDSFL